MIRLTDHIASNGGWISIERLMEIALYDPRDGYYAASIRDVGSRGDFSTSATISPLLARAIAGEWQKACEREGKTLPLIEIGAGNGSLGMAFMEEIGFWKRLKVHYHIVESSANLRQLQHLAMGSNARIHQNMASALKSCKGEAFIFSNELVDAFPARVFEHTEAGWMEVGLTVSDGQLAEALRPIDSIPPSTALECATDIGQRVEVHESYRQWYLSWLPLWQYGIMTTIDYGDTLQQLYHRRPAGTLRAYRNHQMYTGMDVYEHPGQRDITCDVNFSDLLQMLQSCIGDEITLTTQAEYLQPYARMTREDEFLTRPCGAGDHFKVLMQKRFRLSRQSGENG